MTSWMISSDDTGDTGGAGACNHGTTTNTTNATPTVPANANRIFPVVVRNSIPMPPVTHQRPLWPLPPP